MRRAGRPMISPQATSPFEFICICIGIYHGLRQPLRCGRSQLNLCQSESSAKMVGRQRWRSCPSPVSMSNNRPTVDRPAWNAKNKGNQQGCAGEQARTSELVCSGHLLISASVIEEVERIELIWHKQKFQHVRTCRTSSTNCKKRKLWRGRGTSDLPDCTWASSSSYWCSC